MTMLPLLRNLVPTSAGMQMKSLTAHLSTRTLERSEVERSKTWKIQGMRQIESTYNEGKVVLHIHISNSAERGAKKEQGITSSHSTRLHQWNYTPLFLSTLVIPSMYVHKAISHIHREARLWWACLPFLPSREQATKCHQRPLTIDLQATNLQQHHARYCLGLPISWPLGGHRGRTTPANDTPSVKVTWDPQWQG